MIELITQAVVNLNSVVFKEFIQNIYFKCCETNGVRITFLPTAAKHERLFIIFILYYYLLLLLFKTYFISIRI